MLHAEIRGNRGDESVKTNSHLRLSCLANDWRLRLRNRAEKLRK